MSKHTFTGENIVYINQAIDLIDRLDDEQYRKIHPPLYTSGIGSHFRHTLDHYINFLEGIEKGEINYEARRRDPRVEQDRVFARKQFQNAIERLSALSESRADHAVSVKVENGNANLEKSLWADSTLRRELDFLLSHTIHHYSIIALILRLEGFEPGETFGVAPSTLRYHQNKTSCVL